MRCSEEESAVVRRAGPNIDLRKEHAMKDLDFFGGVI